eukprot:TRINITY_DN7731_c1_g4_i1.p1 TRINITY_DN7731_c1_g4~~TRINITY_DN7731_c1_g4_i1.p1  ORF type:complete len:2447 (+),score=671.56 TRINITY_DN7731_c1_g4_i1:59-7342(+)
MAADAVTLRVSRPAATPQVASLSASQRISDFSMSGGLQGSMEASVASPSSCRAPSPQRPRGSHGGLSPAHASLCPMRKSMTRKPSQRGGRRKRSNVPQEEEAEERALRENVSHEFDKLARATLALFHQVTDRHRDGCRKASEITNRADAAVAELVTNGRDGLPSLAPVATAMRRVLDSAGTAELSNLPSELLDLHDDLHDMQENFASVEVDDGSEDEAEMHVQRYDVLFPRSRPSRLENAGRFDQIDFSQLSLPIYALTNSRQSVESLFQNVRRFVDIFRSGALQQGYDVMRHKHEATREELERIREQFERLIREHTQLRSEVKIEQREEQRLETLRERFGEAGAAAGGGGSNARRRSSVKPTSGVPPLSQSVHVRHTAGVGSPVSPVSQTDAKWVQTDAFLLEAARLGEAGSPTHRSQRSFSRSSSIASIDRHFEGTRGSCAGSAAAESPRAGFSAVPSLMHVEKRESVAVDTEKRGSVTLGSPGGSPRASEAPPEDGRRSATGRSGADRGSPRDASEPSPKRFSRPSLLPMPSGILSRTESVASARSDLTSSPSRRRRPRSQTRARRDKGTVDAGVQTEEQEPWGEDGRQSESQASGAAREGDFPTFKQESEGGGAGREPQHHHQQLQQQQQQQQLLPQQQVQQQQLVPQQQPGQLHPHASSSASKLEASQQEGTRRPSGGEIWPSAEPTPDATAAAAEANGLLQFLFQPPGASSSSADGDRTALHVLRERWTQVRSARKDWGRRSRFKGATQADLVATSAPAAIGESPFQQQCAQWETETDGLLSLVGTVRGELDETAARREVASVVGSTGLSVGVRLRGRPCLYTADSAHDTASRLCFTRWADQRLETLKTAVEWQRSVWELGQATRRTGTFVAIHIKDLRKRLCTNPAAAQCVMETLVKKLLQLPSSEPCTGHPTQRRGDFMVMSVYEGESSKQAPSTAFEWLMLLLGRIDSADWWQLTGEQVCDPLEVGGGLAASASVALELARMAVGGEVLVTNDAWQVVSNPARLLSDATAQERTTGAQSRDLWSCVRSGLPAVKPPAPDRKRRQSSKTPERMRPQSVDSSADLLEGMITWTEDLVREMRAEEAAHAVKPPAELPEKGGAVAVVDIARSDRAWAAAAAHAAEAGGPHSSLEDLLDSVRALGRMMRSQLRAEGGWELFSGGDSWVFALPDALGAARWAAAVVEKMEPIREHWPVQLHAIDSADVCNSTAACGAGAVRVGVADYDGDDAPPAAASGDGVLYGDAPVAAALLCASTHPGAWCMVTEQTAIRLGRIVTTAVAKDIGWRRFPRMARTFRCTAVSMPKAMKPIKKRRSRGLSAIDKLPTRGLTASPSMTSPNVSPMPSPLASPAPPVDLPAPPCTELHGLHKRVRVLTELLRRSSLAFAEIEFGVSEDRLLCLWARCISNPMTSPDSYSVTDATESALGGGADVRKARQIIDEVMRAAVEGDKAEQRLSSENNGAAFARSITGYLTRTFTHSIALWKKSQQASRRASRMSQSPGQPKPGPGAGRRASATTADGEPSSGDPPERSDSQATRKRGSLTADTPHTPRLSKRTRPSVKLPPDSGASRSRGSWMSKGGAGDSAQDGGDDEAEEAGLSPTRRQHSQFVTEGDVLYSPHRASRAALGAVMATSSKSFPGGPSEEQLRSLTVSASAVPRTDVQPSVRRGTVIAAPSRKSNARLAKVRSTQLLGTASDVRPSSSASRGRPGSGSDVGQIASEGSFFGVDPIEVTCPDGHSAECYNTTTSETPSAAAGAASGLSWADTPGQTPGQPPPVQFEDAAQRSSSVGAGSRCGSAGVTPRDQPPGEGGAGAVASAPEGGEREAADEGRQGAAGSGQDAAAAGADGSPAGGGQATAAVRAEGGALDAAEGGEQEAVPDAACADPPQRGQLAEVMQEYYGDELAGQHTGGQQRAQPARVADEPAAAGEDAQAGGARTTAPTKAAHSRAGMLQQRTRVTNTRPVVAQAGDKEAEAAFTDGGEREAPAISSEQSDGESPPQSRSQSAARLRGQQHQRSSARKRGLAASSFLLKGSFKAAEAAESAPAQQRRETRTGAAAQRLSPQSRAKAAAALVRETHDALVNQVAAAVVAASSSGRDSTAAESAAAPARAPSIDGDDVAAQHPMPNSPPPQGDLPRPSAPSWMGSSRQSIKQVSRLAKATVSGPPESPIGSARLQMIFGGSQHKTAGGKVIAKLVARAGAPGFNDQITGSGKGGRSASPSDGAIEPPSAAADARQKVQGVAKATGRMAVVQQQQRSQILPLSIQGGPGSDSAAVAEAAASSSSLQPQPRDETILKRRAARAAHAQEVRRRRQETLAQRRSPRRPPTGTLTVAANEPSADDSDGSPQRVRAAAAAPARPTKTALLPQSAAITFPAVHAPTAVKRRTAGLAVTKQPRGPGSARGASRPRVPDDVRSSALPSISF